MFDILSSHIVLYIKKNRVYLQLHEMVGTIISKFMRNLWPLDVSTNNSSEMLGEI